MSPKDGSKKPEVDPFAALASKAKSTQGDIAPPTKARAEDALDAILQGHPPVEEEAVDLSTADVFRPEVSVNALESMLVHKDDQESDDEEDDAAPAASASAPAAAPSRPAPVAAARPAGAADFAARQAQSRKFQQANALAQHQQLKKFAIPLLLVVGILLLVLGGILMAILPPADNTANANMASSPWAKVMVFSAFPMGLILILGAWLFHQDIRRQEKKIADAEAAK